MVIKKVNGFGKLTIFLSSRNNTYIQIVFFFKYVQENIKYFMSLQNIYILSLNVNTSYDKRSWITCTSSLNVHPFIR